MQASETRTCYDCGRSPCVCGDIFPMSRIRTDDGKVYDHLGGLLWAPEPKPEKLRTHCGVCGTRLRGRRALEVGECRRCHK